MPDPNAPVIVGTVSTIAAGAEPWSLPISGVPDGSTLIVLVNVGSGGAFAQLVSDGINSYSSLQRGYGISGTPGAGVFYAQNVTGLGAGATLSVSSTGGSSAGSVVQFVALYLPTGAVPTSFDAENNAIGGFSVTPSSGTITTSQADEIVFGVVFAESLSTSAFTPPAGYTALTTPTELHSGSDFFNTFGQYKIQTSTGTYNGTNGTLGATAEWFALTLSFQYNASVAKSGSDVGTLSDSGALAQLFSKTDSATLTENGVLTTSFPAADSATLGSAALLSAQPHATEPIALTDAGGVGQSDQVADSFTLTDIGVKTTFGASFDNGTLTDSGQVAAANTSMESIGLSDSATVTIPTFVAGDGASLSEAAVVRISTPSASPYGMRWPQPVLNRGAGPVVTIARNR